MPGYALKFTKTFLVRVRKKLILRQIYKKGALAVSAIWTL